MNFAANYFVRYTALSPLFTGMPDADLSIVVIIPCYDDPFIISTLDSLESASTIDSKIEVIVNVNSGENTSPEIVERNRQIFTELKRLSDTGFYKNFKLLTMKVEGTIKKKAGVGYARKTAMDEAVRRFAAIDKSDGLIVSLDADTLVSKHYFEEIRRASLHSDYKCFTFQFRHDFDTEKYGTEVVEACRLYEMYLRYYRLALRTFDVPFAIHTIGSCFAVRAETYVKLGGMNTRQGGEDFYFLQKAVKMHPVHEITAQIVFPSPRMSNRVPFGTGPSVGNIIEKRGKYMVYNFCLFALLKSFYGLFPDMEHKDLRDKAPTEIINYIGSHEFDAIVAECRRYSSSSKAFIKRMYDNFDAFFIVKFLNTFNDSALYPLMEVTAAVEMLLEYYGMEDSSDLYGDLVLADLRAT
ncbi:MAG: glycosyltransferase [Tannerella sp.]|jgi:hypothetical protein|nr:glycosyltransferase [Tannerella sp.]